MEPDKDSSVNQVEISPVQIEKFYKEKGIKIKDRDHYDQEISLFTESLGSPESTRSLLENKLSQLALNSGYENLEEMEDDLSVDKSLDPSDAERAKYGLEDQDNVFFHTTKFKMTLLNDTTKRESTSNYETRLFWVRGHDGKIKEVRTDYPHLDHDTISVSDEKVVVGRVVASGWGSEAEMHFINESKERSAADFVNKFDKQISNQPLKVRVKNIINRFK